jgi:hypothetical protein
MTIRDTLAKPTLELLGDFVNLTRADKDAVLELQAHLLAIHWAQRANPEFSQKDLCKAPRFGAKNKLLLEAEITRLGITTADVERARRTVIARGGMPPDVPLAGKIAVDMELTTAPLLDALVCAQAGETMLQAAERIRRLDGAGAPEALPHLVADRADPAQIARNYIGKYDDDSQAAVSAQACAHLADIAAALPGADRALAAAITAAGQAALRTAAYKLVALHHLSDARDLMVLVPEDTIELTQDMGERWESFVTQGLSGDMGEALLRRRLEQADLSLLLNDDGQHEDMGLKDALRKRLSSAK